VIGGIKLYYYAKVVELNPQIEEEVLLEIKEFRIFAFVNIYPFEINIGREYQIYLELTILDEISINKINYENKNIQQIDNTFSYCITGILDIDKATIDAGIILEIDRDFLFDYGYLHGHYVQLVVDRMTVEFIC
jgi:hypothetical protein